MPTSAWARSPEPTTPNPPVRVRDHHDRSSRTKAFNAALAVGITKIVGSMWCAYAFGFLALISLPDAIAHGRATIISWLAQTFLQLVLLSVIMVGQDVQAKASDARSVQTFDDTEKILDALDIHTDGGIKEVLDAIGELRRSQLPLPVDSGPETSNLGG